MRESIFIVDNGSLDYSNVLYPTNGSFLGRLTERFLELKWFLHGITAKPPFGTFTFGALNVLIIQLLCDHNSGNNIETFPKQHLLTRNSAKRGDNVTFDNQYKRTSVPHSLVFIHK